MNPDQGRRFGPYEIQSRLGGGGMGFVFRAWDARLHREVAIKLLNNDYSMPGMRERFLREARAASALNHPNICTIFDIGEQDGEPYLVMELLEGETLKDRIYRQSIPVDELIRIARETAEALGAAHARGVVHRDVKPANVFLVEKPNGGTQAKILDFGLAKIDGGVLGARGRSLDLTTVGATVGTLAYMSPEQARGEVLDARSDLFSLGVVMYEMATRHVPFQGATSALIFVQLLNHAPEPVRDWNEAVPRELERIILKLLAKDRNARFQTARELELALIALTEKGTGGWLRKAVTAVPLVRATDPVAREKRPSHPRNKTGDSHPSRLTPRPDLSGEGAPPAREPFTTAAADDQFLRPVVRAPRSDSRPPRAASGPQDAGLYDVPVPDPDMVRPSRGGAQIPPQRSSRPELIGPFGAQATAVPEMQSGSGPNAETEELERDGNPVLYPPADPEEDASKRRWWWMVAALMLGLVVLLGLLWVFFHGTFRTAALNGQESIMLTEIDNETAEKALDGAVAEGLELDLAQSPYIHLRNGNAFQAALQSSTDDPQPRHDPQSAALDRRVASGLGVDTYLHGSVTGTSPPYSVNVELREVKSDKLLATMESKAPSLLQIPSAIDEISGEIRFRAGEPRTSIDQFTTPLVREATGNLEALQRFSQGEVLLASLRPLDALKAFQQAASLDPKFTQAYLRRAEILSQLQAETAAADAARQALGVADGTSDRTRILAQAAYEIGQSGDYLRASSLLRALLVSYPHDANAHAMLARTLRLEGHFAEALQAAQKAYSDDPLNSFSYTQFADGLVGLDRYDAVLDVTAQLKRLGLPSADAATAATFLASHVADSKKNLVAGTPVASGQSQAAYLDNMGQLTEGEAAWRTRAAAFTLDESLRSAAASALSRASLNRAMLGDCAHALPLALATDGLPMGRVALHDTGVTLGLCGERQQAERLLTLLQERFPQSFEVANFFPADIRSAIALHDQDGDAALEALRPAQGFDLISIGPLLRGLAHTQLRQFEMAIVDFQTVLSHPGLAFLSGTVIFPAAQVGVARAFAASGEKANSKDAYAHFLLLWRGADANDPLVIEAQHHVGM